MSILQTMSGAMGGFALIICIIAGFGMVSAAELMVSSPDVAKPGEVVEMFIEDVDVGNTLTVSITGQVKTNAGSPLSMQVRDLILPVDLSGTTMTFSASNIADQYGYFSFSGGGYDIDHDAIPVMGGSCSHSYGPVPLDADTEYDMTFNATADKDRSVVNIDVAGTIDQAIVGMDKLSFNAGGFTNGIFNAEVKVMDGATEVSKKNLAFTVQDSLVV